MTAHHPGHPHLPADVAPGPQSRRMRMGRGLSGCLLPFFAVGGLVFALIFIGGAFLLASVPDGPSPLIFGAVGIGGAVLFGGIAYAVYRGFHPHQNRSLAVAVDRVHVQRGDSVRVRLAAGDGASIELGLVCHVACDTMNRTRRHDTHAPSRMTSRAVVVEEWVPATMGAAELTLPPNGPYSYEGSAVSFAWGAYARQVGERVRSAPAPLWVTP